MRFVSTRGNAAATGAEAAVRGLAEDGGLYVPETFPVLSAEETEEMLSMSYAERTALVVGKFFDEYPREELLKEVEKAYAKFAGSDPAPLTKTESGLFLLELFHGPTCAYQDISLAVLPYLLKKGCELSKVSEEILLLTATSGDAGKAALESFRDVPGVKVAAFYPEDGVSKMQKLQLVAQDGENVDVVAVKGNFDDCRSAVKRILRSREQRDKLKEKGVLLSSANSLNVGRMIPQIACFVSAYLDLISSEEIAAGDLVDFAVPAGDFGLALAGYYAKRMGLPVGTIVCASNRNNGFSEFLTKGVLDRKRPLFKTMSPSLDVLVPSESERLLFELSGRDAALTVERMKSLAQGGKYALRPEELAKLKSLFYGGYAGEEDTVECIYEFFEEFAYPLDTHAGVVMHVARQYARKRAEDPAAEERPMVVVAAASPYKFPQAVYYALTGNDVKDSFKGIKRINFLTAMKVPESLKALRYKPPRFKTTVAPEKIFDEVLAFLG